VISHISHMYVLGAQAQQQQGPAGGFTSLLLMIGVLVFLFWIIIDRPRKKQERERNKMLGSIQKGDKVVSIGGIHGTVVEIDDNSDTVTVEVAKNTRLDFTRNAIAQVVKKKQ